MNSDLHAGQAALTAGDVPTAEAARRLVDNALLLRRNAAFALLRIYVAMAWPNSGLASGPSMRLKGEPAPPCHRATCSPATPVRISATS